MNALRKPWVFWACLFLTLAAAKLCDLHILWAEEGYSSAAAVQIWHGKMLYRDFWFDKPLLAALIYVLWHGEPGFGLRLAGALYAFACSAAAYRFAFHQWGRREALCATLLTAFFLLFDNAAAVMTLAPDLLLVLPAIAAVDCAARGRPFLSGLWCSVGLAVNAKALLLVVVCLAWCLPEWPLLAAGFAAGTAPWLLWLAAVGALPAYWEQVWWFGAEYSRNTFVAHPWRQGLLRTLNWVGFHAALVAAVLCKAVNGRLFIPRWLIWILAGVVYAAAGERFFPRYYFFLLPPLVLLGARAIALSKAAWRAVFLCLLLIPLIRFAPRYFMLGTDLIEHRPSSWADLALNEDSKQAALLIDKHKHKQDTLLVWGYRPDLFAYTQLPVAGHFLDSQLLTGVIADRHLSSAAATFPELAAQNRAKLPAQSPAWIVDGLGPLNPALSIASFPELEKWLRNDYERWGQTRFCVIYRRKAL